MMDIDRELRGLKIKKDNHISEDVSISYNDEIYLVSDTLSESKKEKKKKKKEKAKQDPLTNKLDLIMGDSISVISEDGTDSLMELAKSIKKNSKKTGGKLIFDSDAFNEDGSPSGGKKKKDYEKEFQGKFKKESSLLMALLKEADMNDKAIKDIFKKLNGASVRGYNKTLTDIIAAINTSTNNRLSIVKEMVSLNKTICDLAHKKSSVKKDVGNNDLDPEMFGSAMFKELFTQGRKTVLDNVRTASVPNEYNPEQYDHPYDENNQPDVSQLDDFIDKRLEEEHDPFRTSDGNLLIKYENSGVKIKILRSVDSGDWDFIAVDKYGQRIDEYPLPDKKSLGKMTFSDDNYVATDLLGRSYEVVPTVD